MFKSCISQDVDVLFSFFFEGGGLVFCPDQQKQAKYRNVIMNTDIHFIEHKSICNAILHMTNLLIK